MAQILLNGLGQLVGGLVGAVIGVHLAAYFLQALVFKHTKKWSWGLGAAFDNAWDLSEKKKK